MTGSKKYSSVGTKAQPRVGLYLWLEKNPIAPFFTIGFQKPGICSDSWYVRGLILHVQFLGDLKKNQEKQKNSLIFIVSHRDRGK
jgi:hypothetical protein